MPISVLYIQIEQKTARTPPFPPPTLVDSLLLHLRPQDILQIAEIEVGAALNHLLILVELAVPAVVLIVSHAAQGDRVDRLHDDHRPAVLRRKHAIDPARDNELEPGRLEDLTELGPGGVVVVLLALESAGEAPVAGDDILDVRVEPLEEFVDAVGWVGEVEEHLVDFLAGRVRHFFVWLSFSCLLRLQYWKMFMCV